MVGYLIAVGAILPIFAVLSVAPARADTFGCTVLLCARTPKDGRRCHTVSRLSKGLRSRCRSPSLAAMSGSQDVGTAPRRRAIPPTFRAWRARCTTR